MNKSRLFLSIGVGLGALASLMGTREAQAANTNFAIQVTIKDDTTGTTYGPTVIYNQGPYDSSTTSNQITVNSTAYSGAGAVSLTALGATLTENTNSTALTVSGTDQLIGTTDKYTVTVTAGAINLNSPPVPGLSPLLTQSSGGDFTNTNTSSGASQTQSYQGYYGTNSLFNMSGTTPGPQVLAVPNTPNTTKDLAGGAPFSAVPPSYFTPYALTDTVVVTLVGNGNNPEDAFHGTTTISVASVPEPASVVMLLTGMPVPLIVLGMLRRRRKAVAKD